MCKYVLSYLDALFNATTEYNNGYTLAYKKKLYCSIHVRNNIGISNCTTEDVTTESTYSMIFFFYFCVYQYTVEHNLSLT
jgi:hypothetical protein